MAKTPKPLEPDFYDAMSFTTEDDRKDKVRWAQHNAKKGGATWCSVRTIRGRALVIVQSWRVWPAVEPIPEVIYAGEEVELKQVQLV